MEGRHYPTGTAPKSFDLYRVHTPVIGAAARAVGRPGQEHEAGDTYDVTAVDAETVRTATVPLQPAGVLGARRWRFTDNTWWSPTIRTVRGIGLSLKGHVNTPPGFPVDAGIEVKTTLAPGLGDPTVDLSLILPWETGSPHGLTVRDVLRDEVTSSGDVADAFLDEVLGFMADYLPDSNPGWEVFIQPDVLEIAPSLGDTGPVWVEASETTVLWVRANSPGQLAMAVHAVDRNDPEQRAVSSVIAIERAADGTITVLYTDADD